MRGLLEQILQEAEALSAGRHLITLEIDYPDIRGSKDEIRSALTHLVTNAIRYTPEEGKFISAGSTLLKGRFSVTDNGIGISPEHISRLTERFYRVDKSRSRETQGTGLGLAIVKHVLLRHKAQLLIDSTPALAANSPCSSPQISLSKSSGLLAFVYGIIYPVKG
jgi:two-component system phosphate regulon sensor histidine kinase PhoR